MSNQIELSLFIKWGSFKSKTPSKPDILECKVIELETFPTEYSENTIISYKENEKWQNRTLPLKSHESSNSQLLQLWQKAVKQKKLKKGMKFRIKTYLGRSKNGRPIRRFKLEI